MLRFVQSLPSEEELLQPLFPWQGDNFRLLHGHVIEVLAQLPAKSVQCVVTSPPYWGLRDYHVPPVEWADGWVGCLGLEPSWQSYTAHLVEVFEQVWRVLRDDGTVWLNLGDNYAAQRSGTAMPAQTVAGGVGGKGEEDTYRGVGTTHAHRNASAIGLKHKDLIGIPWRAAFALQDAGWYLRSEIIWAKPNPMPESVTDRPTRSHEPVFLLTKRDHYFYDLEAIAEPVIADEKAQRTKNKTRMEQRGKGDQNGTYHARGEKAPFSNWKATRNKRSVWVIPTQSYRGAHFAVMPDLLATTCVAAGTSEEGACEECGAPWVRVVEDGAPLLAYQQACGGDSQGHYTGHATKDYASAKAQDPSATKARILAGMKEKITVGWQPSCECGGQLKPCVVLDPFCGSGTTGVVSLRSGRQFIGVDAKEEYVQISANRIHAELYAQKKLALQMIEEYEKDASKLEP